ncbi:methyltransferase domain-containing protein [Streptomyces goshikiensis]|uniref:Protein-L-isoaspartate O-methyltransferase n=1 Tax=Streptomyces goshikiensis TaxID=1942 RepID=A0ABZ1RNN6_9ACTN|nr:MULTISPECIES: methyltransferase domain-containing protein [Streptomyces]AKL66186.1 methyltransferase [Streptomyces sp. Mg1]AYV27784.1 Protein-L-isoaspartate O-methyltransferase [Streptomyces sp. ADI95-16]EDX24619.1 O-methyltransferase [Streptomyces sp. Mg1]MBP0934341.1 methyltransferase domain-containing protein [Streptomyces sp. KCTC 0041BP]MBT1183495.1 methyltransferase domain-containing protein [Streptomyces sp. CJ_13]
MGAHPEVRDVRETAHAAQVRELDAAGVLVDPAWRAAFEGVPRHAFVPYFWTGRGAGHERLWGEDPDPEQRARWLRGVYTDTPLATRLRDGELVSSSSQPSLMAKMLNALDVRDGHRVLEIGTGTGYNAALLCHRLGDDLVTTVDLEEEITESARTHLAALGYRPTVVTGDGARGCPSRAPFDRILVTCTLPRIPPAWLGQCRPGARVLAPLSTGLIALTVRDAELAEGRFLHTSAYFVPLRGATAAPPPAEPSYGLPYELVENERFQFMLVLTAGALHAREALDLWRGEGRPARERFGVTVTPEGQWSWLDDPQGPYVWPLGETG